MDAAAQGRMHNSEPGSSLVLVSEPTGSIVASSPFRRPVHRLFMAPVGNLSPNMGGCFSTVGEHHGTSDGQDDAKFGLPAHHARVSFGSLCERILFDHGAHTRHFREP